MAVLGWLVRGGPTRLDTWFLTDARGVVGPNMKLLLNFTDPQVLVIVLLLAVAVALRGRRWRLAAVVAVCPIVAIAIAQMCKPLFGRTKAGALAYPSGHTTALVVVVGMVVLVVGARIAVLGAAAVVVGVGMLGPSMTFHYYTDCVGALFLGTAIVCIAAQVAGSVPAGRGSPGVDPPETDRGNDNQRYPREDHTGRGPDRSSEEQELP